MSVEAFALITVLMAGNGAVVSPAQQMGWNNTPVFETREACEKAKEVVKANSDKNVIPICQAVIRGE